MLILFLVYLATVALAFYLGAKDFKNTFKYVDVGDVIFLTVMSLLPIGNIGVILAAGSSILRSNPSSFLHKTLF